MQIEVIHDPDHLPCRRIVKVKNATAAYAGLQRFMETKRSRGMKLRFTYDVKDKLVTLEGRTSVPGDIAHQYLSDAGHIRST